MNIMKRLTWKSMVKNRTRTIVTVIGIALSAALFCGITTLGASIISYLIDLQIAVAGDYHVSVTVLPDEKAEAVRTHKDVKSVAEAQILGVVNFYGEELGLNSGLIKACNDQYFEAMPGFDFIEGRLPQNSSELVIGEYLLHTMEAKGYPIELGSEISLTVTPMVQAMEQGDPSASDFTITGTIVGILPFSYDTTPSHERGEYSHIYTFLDENTPAPLYCDLFLKATSPYRAVGLAASVKGTANYDLLQYYGIAEAGNITIVIAALMAVVIAIVMVGTVSLISNAFSISVAQRTQEFGLLSSVGATKKQLRKSVRFEAGLLCLFGLPVGLLIGFCAMALLLNTSGDTVESMLAVAQTGVDIKAVANPVALLGAAGITAAAVFLSAWIPSARVARVTPMMAIRQATEYQVDKKARKTAQKWCNPGRISANMAAKYYRTNRKKYRSIILALGISVILFLSATGVSSSLQHIAGSYGTENFDFSVSNDDAKLYDQVRQYESVAISVMVDEKWAYMIIPEGSESQQRLDAFAGTEEMGIAELWRSNPAQIYYLEDDAFRAYLLEQGIDPEPFFDKENPLAVVFYQKWESQELRANGEKTYTKVAFPPFHDGVTELTFMTRTPDVEEYIAEQIKAQGYADTMLNDSGFDRLDDGRIIFRQSAYGCTVKQQGGGLAEIVAEGDPQTFVFLAVEETDAAGQPVMRYYAYDEKTGAAGNLAIAEEVSGSRTIGIGAQINGIPFGISVNSQHHSWLSLLRPLSMLDIGVSLPVLRIRTNDYLATKNCLNALDKSGGTWAYTDYMAEQYQMRQVSRLINLFAFTFVAVMTLISVANIFNIVSTNILLRRKDIGMLRSLGMSMPSVSAMTAKEYALCGIRALCWSLPIGLFMDYLVKRILAMALTTEYVFPWAYLAIIVGCVFAVVGSSVVYALNHIRKDNPIDAIRMENI